MTYQTRPPVNPRFSSPPLDELDGLLRRFYRTQMPDPWPAAPRVASAEETPPSPRRVAVGRFFRPTLRVALAAAVAFLVIGYLALQGWFPDPSVKPASSQMLDTGSGIGSRLPQPKRQVPSDVQQKASNSGGPMIFKELPAKK
jgi:hypothetical protein